MFGVLRIDKHKSNASLTGMKKHNGREYKMDHVDLTRTHLNVNIVGDGQYTTEVRKALDDIGGHVQKNSVIAIEHIITASPEFFKTNGQLLANHAKPIQKKTEGSSEVINLDMHNNALWHAAMDTIKDHYGPESKVVSASLHLDEKTPHFHIFVVPVAKSKLKGKKGQPGSGKDVLRVGSKSFIGTRAKLSELQDTFGKHVEKLGLQRGIKKDKTGAFHVPPQKFYTLLKETQKKAAPFSVNIPKVNVPPMVLMNREAWSAAETKRIKESVKDDVKAINNEVTGVAQNAMLETLSMVSGKDRAEKKRAADQIAALEKQLKEALGNADYFEKLATKYIDNSKLTDIFKSICTKVYKDKSFANLSLKEKQCLSDAIKEDQRNIPKNDQDNKM